MMPERKLVETPAGLRARARVRLDEAEQYPLHSHERRRQTEIAAGYERLAAQMEVRNG